MTSLNPDIHELLRLEEQEEVKVSDLKKIREAGDQKLTETLLCRIHSLAQDLLSWFIRLIGTSCRILQM